MTRRVIGIAWFCAAMVLFLVAIAPACSFAAKARAASARLIGCPASPGNPNEEDEREGEPAKLKGIRPTAAVPSTIPGPPPPCAVRPTARRAIAPVALRISRAVLPWLHQARFSERRLI